MHPLLEYPFDAGTVLKKRRAIRRELLDGRKRLKKRIAILGGSTTHDIRELLELFLLDGGIEPEFYESDYGRFYEDALFGAELESFSPELVFIHTSNRNITEYPALSMTTEETDGLYSAQMQRFIEVWEAIGKKFSCPVVQNNFELPYLRVLGSLDSSDVRGRTSFILRMNEGFAGYARSHTGFHINDINYLSADYGLRRWSDPLYWHMYKYFLCTDAMPAYAFAVSNIIKSVYGLSKKALALDLDNTLWGGTVGDDGAEGIEIGMETPTGQVYAGFQSYVKQLSQRGIILAVNSKNDAENAVAGLRCPGSRLAPEDFAVIKANWEPKDENIAAIADELGILPESIVFADDNPAERARVKAGFPEVCAPALDTPEHYAAVIDRGGFFETSSLSEDDLKRTGMYRANAGRENLRRSFSDYGEYLRSLEMRASIGPFAKVYIPRIAQLTNKSNQFNLTTLRLSEGELAAMAASPEYVCRCAGLADRFGDNGIVTVVAGREKDGALELVLWLMSCRVLKRGVENAMLDEMAEAAAQRGLSRLRGLYRKTAKNGMVENFYADMGFERISAGGGDSVWELDITGYKKKNDVIVTERGISE